MAGKRRHYLQLSNGSVPGVSLRFRALSGRADQMCSFPNCLFFLTCDMQSGCDEEGIDAGNLNSIHLRKRRSLAGKSRAPRQSSQFLSGSRPALPILDWRPAQFCVATGHARMFEECRADRVIVSLENGGVHIGPQLQIRVRTSTQHGDYSFGPDRSALQAQQKSRRSRRLSFCTYLLTYRQSLFWSFF
jgi:hypothetical protein